MDSFDDKLRKQGEEIHKKAYDNQEKIEEALKVIKELEKWWESGQAIYLHDNPQGRALMAHVDQIKKILEK